MVDAAAASIRRMGSFSLGDEGTQNMDYFAFMQHGSGCCPPLQLARVPLTGGCAGRPFTP
jgi:hypothetical protein